MAIVILPNKWRHTPISGPVTVDWNNPISQGLILAWSGDPTTPEAIHGYLSTSSTIKKYPSTNAGRSFMGTAFNGTTDFVQIEASTALYASFPQDFSFAAYINPGSAVNCQPICSTSGGITNGFDIVVGTSGTAGNLQARLNNAAAYTTTGTNDGNWHLITAGRKASTFNYFIDRLPQGAGLSNSAAIVSTAPVTLGKRATTFCPSPSALALVWNRYVTQAEHNELYVYPWQIFKPTRGRVYILSAAVSNPLLTIQDDWDWLDEVEDTDLTDDGYSSQILNQVSLYAIEDAWDWLDEVEDTDLTDDGFNVQILNPFLNIQDAWDWLDEVEDTDLTDDGYSSRILNQVSLYAIEDAWNWLDEIEDTDLTDDGYNSYNFKFVNNFEDAWDWLDEVEDTDLTDDAYNVQILNKVTLAYIIEDAWDWLDEVEDTDLTDDGSNVVNTGIIVLVPVAGVTSNGTIGQVAVWAGNTPPQYPNWIPVPDSQSPSWILVPDAQTPGWTPVPDVQNPGWGAIINTLNWTADATTPTADSTIYTADIQSTSWVSISDVQNPGWGAIINTLNWTADATTPAADSTFYTADVT